VKLLLTGACGFVGSTIARELVHGSAPGSLQIIGIDNFSRPGSWRNRRELQSLGVTLVHGDTRCASDLETVDSVDWVIDAAAIASVTAGVDGQSSSRQLVEHNLLGTVNLLEYCRRSKAGFILLSSSRVYSLTQLAALPLTVRDDAFVLDSCAPLPAGVSAAGISESFSTESPVSLYGATKLASERLALEYGNAFEFPVWINRCGVLAGAGQFGRADQGIFAYWLHSWKEDRPLKYIGFTGQGHQVRDCLHARDIVPLLRKQLDNPAAAKPRIVHLSGGSESAISLADLSRWCRQRWGHRVVTQDPQPRPFDLPWVVLDHGLAGQVWDWRPSTPLDQILDEIATFAEDHPDWIELSK
jgi:CDP-paratose 2-epimerase